MSLQTRGEVVPCSTAGRHVVPFLKWAGGKRWLVSGYPNLFPTQFDRYIEPFLGSAAVYFHLSPKRALLTDINPELINVYQVIQDDWEALFRRLQDYQRNHSDEFYYAVRAANPVNRIGRAARFIYLNRTCWNGLYRVNKRGVFNVPRGTKDSVILDTDDFEAVSKLMKNATIKVADFEQSIDEAAKGDLLFVDPPYTAKHNQNGFLKYNENIFSWEDQLRLKCALKRADDRGVLMVLTNANHKSVRDLYTGFRKQTLSRQSVLAAKSSARGATEELIVRNFS